MAQLRYLVFHFLFTRNVPVEVVRGCDWLVKHRLPDGGWGENFESCEQKVYIPAETSQVVNTAWALLALMAVRWAYLLFDIEGVAANCKNGMFLDQVCDGCDRPHFVCEFGFL